MIEAGVQPIMRTGVTTCWATDGTFGEPKELIELYGRDGKKGKQ
jgi:hypothetical protein